VDWQSKVRCPLPESHGSLPFPGVRWPAVDPLRTARLRAMSCRLPVMAVAGQARIRFVIARPESNDIDRTMP